MVCVPASSVLLPLTPANCRNSSSGTDDGCARRAGAVVVGGAVGALHELRADVHIVHEALDAVEDVAAVGEADEGLGGGGAVELGAELEVVRAANQRDVVVHLEPRVVILHRNEERQAEAVLAAEIDAGVRQGAVLAGQAGAGVVARAVFARELEARFVERGGGNRGVQLQADGVGEVALDGVGAARPTVPRRRCRSAAARARSCSAR